MVTRDGERRRYWSVKIETSTFQSSLVTLPLRCKYSLKLFDCILKWIFTTIQSLENNSTIFFVCSFILDCMRSVGITELNIVLVFSYQCGKEKNDPSVMSVFSFLIFRLAWNFQPLKPEVTKMFTCENIKPEILFCLKSFWILSRSASVDFNSCCSLDKGELMYKVYLTLRNSSVSSPSCEFWDSSAARKIPTGSGS